MGDMTLMLIVTYSKWEFWDKDTRDARLIPSTDTHTSKNKYINIYTIKLRGKKLRYNSLKWLWCRPLIKI